MIRESVALYWIQFFIFGKLWEYFTVDMINTAISGDYFTIFPHFLTTRPHRMVNSTYHHNYIIYIVITLAISISPTFLTTVSE